MHSGAISSAIAVFYFIFPLTTLALFNERYLFTSWRYFQCLWLGSKVEIGRRFMFCFLLGFVFTTLRKNLSDLGVLILLIFFDPFCVFDLKCLVTE